MGRPTKYSPELADKICEEIATSEKGLHHICKSNNFPSASTILRWLTEDDKKDFRDKYTRAREAQADYMAEQILEIADNSDNDTIVTKNGIIIQNSEYINRSRLRVDTRKWLMSKLAPKKYGEKLDISGNVKNINSVPLTPEQIKEINKSLEDEY